VTFLEWSVWADQRVLQGDAKRLCFVCQRNHFAAGLAQDVLGNGHAVACGACVGVHSEAMLADAADFCAQVANAHFLGFGGGQCLTVFQCGKNFVRLGFGIDEFHSNTFL